MGTGNKQAGRRSDKEATGWIEREEKLGTKGRERKRERERGRGKERVDGGGRVRKRLREKCADGE